MTSDLDDVVDDLYAGTPADFVARRTAAVKAARADGDRDLAAAIAELRKPTVSAWLVNLLVRDDPDLAGQIVALGEGLRDAEKSLDGPALRELTAQRRQLVRSLVARARRLAQPTGQKIGDPITQELDATLTAALADPAVAQEVVSGRLTAAREYAGFGSADAMGAPVAVSVPQRAPKEPARLTVVGGSGRSRATRPAPAEEPPEPEEGGETRAERERRLRREEREQRARDEAQAAWEAADRAATEARQRHDDAVAARDDSAEQVARAEARAARAHEEEDDLVRELAEVRRRLAAAGKAATVADRDVGLAQQTLRHDDREVATTERELNRAERAREAAAAARDER
ncbi:hypothetical protein [Cellulomonas sp. ICMP 17802]|uniref:hypothetical protein n=1 Tax=Cellulomonas sp. ICMP 17802 TaxID=3239199 RepID=UPI00351B911E